MERWSYISTPLGVIIKEHNLNGKKYCKRDCEAIFGAQAQYKETSEIKISTTHSSVELLTWQGWEA